MFSLSAIKKIVKHNTYFILINRFLDNCIHNMYNVVVLYTLN